LSDGSMRSDCE